MSLLNAISTGLSSLNATGAALEVLSHNVANASTDGYSRQRLELNAARPVARGGLFIGQGVDMRGVSRVADGLLGRRLVGQTGFDASASTLRDNLSVVETFFDETQGTSPSEKLQQLYDALGAATSDPADDGLRTAVVSSARELADAMNYTATGLSESIQQFDTSIQESVSTTNTSLQALADVNKQIASGGGASGDTLDARDRLVEELAGTLGATVSIEGDGQATLLVGGQAVVSGSEARTLSVGTDAAGMATVRVSVGSGFVDVTGYAGGVVGGLVDSRELTQGYLDRLDEFAATFADAFNAQHASGFDANGNPGGDLFTYDPAASAASFSVEDAFLSDSALLAFGGDGADAGDTGNLEALSALESAGIFDGGSRTGESFLAALTGDVARDAAAASSSADQSTAALGDLQALRQAISGVNLDEEAVTMIEVQSAYEAAARVISTADDMLQTLMQM